MGDKGGKKNKDKSQKQSSDKHKQKEQNKIEKQQKNRHCWNYHVKNRDAASRICHGVTASEFI